MLCGACSRKSDYQPPELQPSAGNAGSGGTGGKPAFPVTGINSGKLTVTGVDPGTGPYSGGTTAVVRGSGFDDGVVVRVGGIAVQPDLVTRDGKNRINVVIPAGMVGPADVTVTQGDNTVTLPAGYIYNGLAVSPNRGAAAGGSLVELRLSGTTFEDKTVVEFDGAECTEFLILSPQLATCKTPAHTPGIVDVIARRPSDATIGGGGLIASKSYEFAETLDAANGGLSGGPIEGTINVTVVSDGGNGNVIPGALVLLGNDPKTSLKGYTDSRGAKTFSVPDLKGPVTLHASAKCFQRGSIVSFDAKDVTLFLSPVLDPTCAADAEPGPGIKQLAATISGELVFPGFQEFEVGTWDIVPKPKDKEIRVAYVYTTQATLDSRNPEPDSAGAELARVTEDTAIAGTRGYLYRIAARAGGLAVYALAGLERLDTHEFTPYVMGIAHNVVTSPGDEKKGVDLSMTITLDRELGINLSGVPAATPDGPTEYRVRAYADLGGEGLIVRTVNGVSLDVMIRHTGTEPFRFLGQPAFVGGLSDASYYVLAGFYTTDVDVPFTTQKRNGVLQSASPLRFSDFLGIPLASSPELGATIPSDRTLRFKLDGPSPDLIMVDIAGGDGQVAWTEILPGTAREAPIPDLSSIPGQADITPGFIQWMVTAVKIDQFRYNEFQYTYLSNRYWTHTSRNVFFARR